MKRALFVSAAPALTFAQKEIPIPRSIAGDEGAYSFLEAKRIGDTVSSLHKRVGIDSVGFTRLEVNRKTMQVRDRGYGEDAIANIKASSSDWFDLAAAVQQDRRSQLRIRRIGPMTLRKALWLLALVPGLVFAHGGGLDGDGCHTNRKTGDYHCHRGGSASSSLTPQRAFDAQVSNDRATTSTGSGPTCYTGPRGGTYTITKSGRKNYSGC